jgi:hypothetical protein
MMFVFEKINQGLDEGEVVGGDYYVSLHFDAGPALFVWLLQGFLSQSSKRAINPSKINTKQTPNHRQLPTQSVIRHFICSRLLFASCCAVWSKVGKEKGSVQ